MLLAAQGAFYKEQVKITQLKSNKSKPNRSFIALLRLNALTRLHSIIEGGGTMINTTETQKAWARPILGPVSLRRRLASYELLQRIISVVEATSYDLIGRRFLSTIALCSIVWLASIWLAAAIVQAHESTSDDTRSTARGSTFVQGSIEKPQAPQLLLSMVDSSDREPGALRNSAVHLTGPHPMDVQNGGEVRLSSNPRGAEFASLANLASTPPSSLLYSIQAKGSGQADTSSLTNDNKAVVCQLGTINLVINRLPNSFSVSSPRNSLSDAR